MSSYFETRSLQLHCVILHPEGKEREGALLSTPHLPALEHVFLSDERQGLCPAVVCPLQAQPWVWVRECLLSWGKGGAGMGSWTCRLAARLGGSNGR